MALNPHIALAARKAALDAGMNLANTGFIDILDGTQPANADTAITTQNVLASFALSNPAFSAAAGSAGATTTKALTLPANVLCTRSGTAAWFRMYQSDHATAVADGSVGTASADLIVGTTTFTINGSVSLTGTNQYTFPA